MNLAIDADHNLTLVSGQQTQNTPVKAGQSILVSLQLDASLRDEATTTVVVSLKATKQAEVKVSEVSLSQGETVGTYKGWLNLNTSAAIDLSDAAQVQVEANWLYDGHAQKSNDAHLIMQQRLVTGEEGAPIANNAAAAAVAWLDAHLAVVGGEKSADSVTGILTITVATAGDHNHDGVYADLDENGKVPSAQLPDAPVTSVNGQTGAVEIDLTSLGAGGLAMMSPPDLLADAEFVGALLLGVQYSLDTLNAKLAAQTPKLKSLSSQVAITSVTPANIAALAVDLDQVGKHYVLKYLVYYSCANSSEGLGLGFAVSSTGDLDVESIVASVSNYSTATVGREELITAPNTFAQMTAGNTTGAIARIEAHVKLNSPGGDPGVVTLSLQAKAETGAYQITIQPGSMVTCVLPQQS